MAKWIAAEKARAELRHIVVCPNVTGRTKERISQSKCARAGSLAVVDLLQGARTCILRADVVLLFSGVTIVNFLLCFRCFLLFCQSRASSFNRYSLYICPGSQTQFPIITTVCALSCLVFFVLFCFMTGVTFSEYFVSLLFPLLYREYPVRFSSAWCLPTLWPRAKF